MLFRALTLAVCALALAVQSAHAQYSSQLEEKTIPVGDFTSISVSDDFEVSLVKGACSARVTADKELFPYVQVYVRGKVLHIIYDEKSVPKDIKKLFKGRGAPTPVFRAVVSMPTLGGITLSNNVTLTSTDEFPATDFDLNLSDKAQVKNLSLKTSGANLNMKKNSQAILNIRAEKRLEINTEGNANLRLTADAAELSLAAAGSSEMALSIESKQATLNLSGTSNITMALEAERTVLQAGGSSDLTITGESEQLSIRGEKSALVEANGFSVKKVEASMSGSSRINVSVSEHIDATLVGGSALYYTGTPSIQRGKIIKSTLAPYGSTAK